MSQTLALLGGEPVRKESYPPHSTMIDEAEEKEVLEVLRSGHLSGFSGTPGDRFLGGPKVRRLEDDFAERFGVSYAVSFNSATSALHGVVAAALVGPGDEVITTPTTMCASASCILMQNALPVFADIEEETFGLDPASVEERITPRTKAILTVNLFGHPSRLAELKEIADRRGLVLIEENAQSPGAFHHNRLVGTLGKMGVFSLNYHKGIQTGEGGMVLTDDEEAAAHLRLHRNHGEVVVGPIGREDITNMLGGNYRLTELQAAVGIPQLAKLDTLNTRRIDLADLLAKRLRKFDFLTAPRTEEECTHVFYLFAMRYDAGRIGISRKTFVEAMQAEGISIGAGYVRPIYLEPLYQRRIVYGREGCPFTCSLNEGSEVSYARGICPTAEQLHFNELLTTDICKFPNTPEVVEEFARAVEKVYENRAALLAREKAGGNGA